MSNLHDDDLRQAYEVFDRDHVWLRTLLLASLPERSGQYEPGRQAVGYSTRARIFAIAAAAAIIIGFTLWLGLSKPSDGRIGWNEVAGTFESVSFFHATVYVKENALSEPQQFELWMGHGGKTRLRFGSQVLFGQGGGIVKAFDMEKRAPCAPHRAAVQILERLERSKGLSLERVVKAIGGKISISPSVVGDSALLSKDLTVFDVTNRQTPEWVRIWALRSSRLPIRIRQWDSRGHGYMDVLFSYSGPQPREFFDPVAFSKELSAGSGALDSSSEASLHGAQKLEMP